MIKIADVDKNNLIDVMLNYLPELHQAYVNELADWDNGFPGFHILLGNILNPFLIKLLAENKDLATLKRAFEFLECMAHSSDLDVQNVLNVTVLERLGDDPLILKRSYEYMGEKTRTMSDEMEEYWLKLMQSK